VYLSRVQPRSEEGAVAVIAAVVSAALLTLTALVVTSGEWFTHKRQLQIRADSGALAAGVEYTANWSSCIEGGDGSATATAIATAARQYAGDPTAGGTLYNTEIANQSKVDVRINSTSYDSFVSDGGGPCFKHAGDDISPAGGYWTDVKVKERDFPSVFGSFGIPLLRNIARARVEIRPAIDKGFLPLGISDSQISKMQVRLYRACGTEEELGRDDLTKLPMQYQTQSNMSLWARYDGSSFLPTTMRVPQITECTAAENIPIRVEVRIASRDAIDIVNPTCQTLATRAYADCWSHLTHIRVFDGGGNPDAKPVLREVTLAPIGGNPCAPDAYFARFPTGATTPWNCSYGASLKVDWGDRLAGSSPDKFFVSVEGVNLPNKSAVSATEMTFDGVGINTSDTPPGGADPVAVTLRWLDTNPMHTAPGGAHCTNNANNTPCKYGPVTIPAAHQTYVGDDTTAGIVELVRVTSDDFNGGLPSNIYSSIAAAGSSDTTISVNLTVGLRTNLAFGNFAVIRAGDPQGNNSLVCDPDYTNGKTFQMFRDGCKPPYSANEYANNADPFWWDTVADHCPAGNQWFDTSYPHAPWRCLKTEPGFRPGQISDGLAAATGNCIPGNNGCNNFMCNSPNFYQWHVDNDPDFAKMPPGWGDPPDKRLIKVYIIPYNALRNSNGNDEIPVLDFSYFYVSGWIGQGNNQDPCNGTEDPNAQPNENAKAVKGGAVGYFVKPAPPPSKPVDSTQNCAPSQLRPCYAVLVR
jgi:Putative Flp pilus-assembly TadE/G-like